jgi:hypothetical protein
MHNHFLLHPTELRHEWRELRKQLATDVEDVVHYQTVIDWWSSAPLSKRYLDYTTCADWLDPWVIIDRKEFDTNSISLCMFYTLLFADGAKWKSDRVSLEVVVNRKHSTEQLVCVVDGQWLLGYQHSRLINLNDESDIERGQTYNYNSRLRCIEETTKWKFTDTAQSAEL